MPNPMARVAAGLVVLVSFAVTPAMACEGKRTILEDKFVDQLSGWDADPLIKIGDQAMTISLKADDKGVTTNNVELNSNFLVKEADICAEANFPAAMDGVPGAGIVFAAVDYNSYFLFMVRSSGKAGVYRKVAGQWTTLAEEEAASIKREGGASNILRVVTKGNLISTFVNGTKFRDFRAQVPDADWKFGVYAQTDKAAATPESRTFKFRNFKVTSAD